MESNMLQIQGDRTILYNDVTIECEAKIFSYIELTDLIMVQVLFKSETYEESNYGFQNIFCYNKIDGSLKWQVESKEGSPYVGVGIAINKGDDTYSSKEDVGVIRAGKFGEIESQTYLAKQFRRDVDLLIGTLASGNKYFLDVDRGSVTLFRQGK